MIDWQLIQVPFKYQLSDRTLFSTRLPLQCRSVGLGDELPAASSPAAPAPSPTAATEGYLTRALPVQGDQPEISRVDGYIRYIPLQYRHSYIDLHSTFDDYLGKFSSKTRSTLRRKVRKYEKHCGGSIPWKRYRSSEQMPAFFELARQVSALTYQEKLLDAGLPESPQFLQRLQQLADAGRVEACILFDGERPVSYLCCLAENGILTYDYQGYDPAYARLSVGTVLFWLMIEQLFAEQQFRIFDFTEGQSQHKQLFSTHHRECANVYFIRNSLRNRFIVHSHRLSNAFSRWLGEMLDRMGLKAKVKKLLRKGG